MRHGKTSSRALANSEKTGSACRVQPRSAMAARSHDKVASCAVTIQRAQDDLFAYFENPILLPSILRHLHGRFEGEEAREAARGAGVARLILTQRIAPRIMEWEARLEDATLYQALASFRPAPGGRGTEVRLSLELPSEPGPLAKAFDLLRGRDPAFLLREDLRNFKQYMETGEYPTTRGQPSGRRSLRGRALTAFIGERLQRELSQSDAQMRPLFASGHNPREASP